MELMANAICHTEPEGFAQMSENEERLTVSRRRCMISSEHAAAEGRDSPEAGGQATRVATQS